MALIWADRVGETSTTTGTGDFTLAGAMTSFRRFSDVCATSDTFYYLIEAVDASGIPTGAWEAGLGTYSASNTLTRTTVHASSNAGAAVNFGAGTKRVTLSATARGQGLVFLGNFTGSGAAQADIPLPSGYQAYRLQISLTAGTDATSLQAQVTDDNFATVESGASDYMYNYSRAAASSLTNTADDAHTSVVIASTIESSAGGDVQGEVTVLYAGDATKYTEFICRINLFSSGGNFLNILGNGRYNVKSAVNGVRLTMSSGTLTYDIDVWGLVK